MTSSHPPQSIGPSRGSLRDSNLVGQRVLGYELLRCVANGNLATVYQARKDNLHVAIKLYRAEACTGEWVRRIERESAAQREISHPCVARFIECGVFEGCAVQVSEWIHGASLEGVLSSGPMPWPALSRLMKAIVSGLGAIHSAGIVHRDLKPSNIMVPAHGDRAAVILDFGHSLIIDAERLTDRGQILGSVSYMAPEQAAGLSLDARADLYALGVIFYRALTGVLPFVDASPAVVLRKHQGEPVVPPRKQAAAHGVSQAAEDLCLWLLTKNPDRRVPSARVLAFTLSAVESPNATADQGRGVPV